MSTVDDLDLLEAILVGHRGFGDSAYLHEQMRQTHLGYLSSVADSLPAAGRLLTALDGADAEQRYRVLGSTVVRCAAQQAYLRVLHDRAAGLPLQQSAVILEAAADRVASGPVGCLPLDDRTTRSRRVGDRDTDGAAWCAPAADDELTSAYRNLIRQNYGSVPDGAHAADLDRVRAGVRLLRQVAPRLAESALSHAHLVVVFASEGRWRGTGSSSQYRLAGTIFVGRDLLGDPWTVAEQMLHESLHQKLYDFRFGHTMFGAGDPGSTPALVRSPWNAFDAKHSNYWDTFRVFAAFHVYVHLTFLSQMALARTEAEPIPGLPAASALRGKAKAAAHRARYLGEQLASEACWDELGPGGRRLHRWLTDVLDALDADPPPPRADLHLLLDLYRKEAIQVRTSGHRLDAGMLGTLLADELAEAQSLLRAQGVDEARLPTLERGPADRLPLEFYETRRNLALLLRELSPDGYRLDSRPGDEEATAAARRLIESSSARLSALLRPPAPAEPAGEHRAQ